MRRYYPYLEDSYYEDLNAKRKRREFLQTVDNFFAQKQYIRITLLDWEERPLKEIQGELSTGTITKDGSSTVRRTCQFTASVDATVYDIDDIEAEFSINKKVFIELGLKNYSNQYKEYPILWFPQGIYFIQQFSMSASASSAVSLSLSLGDKMLGLNGFVGGVFSSTTVLDEVDTQTPSGEYVSNKVRIYDIIKEIVHHFGGEPLDNIVIEDVPLRTKMVMQWRGSKPLYLLVNNTDSGAITYTPTLTDLSSDMETSPAGTILRFIAGQDVGYEYVDFVYNKELVASTGDTVCTILDTIVEYLGNYEYFYDEMGIFHFREIKNYLNTTFATTAIEDMTEHNYLVDITAKESAYTFADDRNLISISVNPQYENIKNDYIVEGKRQMTNSDTSYPVMYHLAIDNKPIVGNQYNNLLLYKEAGTELLKAAFPVSYTELPSVGDFNLIYKLGQSMTNTEEYQNYYDQVFVELPKKEKELYGVYKKDEDGNVVIDKETGESIKLSPGKIDDLEKQEKIVADTIARIKEYSELVSGDSITDYRDGVQKYIDNMNNKLATKVTQLDDNKSELEDIVYIYDFLTVACDYNEVTNLYNGKVNATYINSVYEVIDKALNLTQQKYEMLKKLLQQEDRPDSKQHLNEQIQETLAEERKHSTNRAKFENLCKEREDLLKYQKEYYDNKKGALEIATIIQDGGQFETDQNLLLSLRDQVKTLKAEIAAINKLEDPSNVFYYWTGDSYKRVNNVAYYISGGAENGTAVVNRPYVPKDWRTELYLQGLLASNIGQNYDKTQAEVTYQTYQEKIAQKGKDYSVSKDWIEKIIFNQQQTKTNVNFYWEELDAFWPQIYDLYEQHFYGTDGKVDKIIDLTTGNYFLDFIDPETSGLGAFSIKNIGRRTDAVIKDDVNCLFEPNILELVWIYVDDDPQNRQQVKTECELNHIPYVQVTNEFYQGLSTGGNNNAAFDQIKFELWSHTSYQKTLSITAIPSFHLEPNTRVTINDKTTNTYGDFMVTSISLPLGPSSVMGITCNECVKKM